MSKKPDNGTTIKNHNLSTTKRKAPKKRLLSTIAWEESVADRLTNWSMSPEAFLFEEFLVNNDLPRTTFYQAVDRNDKLKEAHAKAMLRIGINRHNLAIKRNESMNNTNSFALPAYLPVYREQMEFRAKLKQDQDSKSNISIVEVPCLSCTHKKSK